MRTDLIGPDELRGLLQAAGVDECWEQCPAARRSVVDSVGTIIAHCSTPALAELIAALPRIAATLKASWSASITMDMVETGPAMTTDTSMTVDDVVAALNRKEVVRMDIHRARELITQSRGALTWADASDTWARLVLGVVGTDYPPL